ncbi:iron chaperone [Streptomyces sp. NPDC014861]|uniref:iron chaperone n=1 Tax=Streptomyces sp. NPDC014861 TaxID=3364923 RepID=UPI0036FAF573
MATRTTRTTKTTRATDSTATAEPAKSYDGFTEDEREAMKERAKELKAGKARASRAKAADGEADLLAKVAEMPDEDRVLAEGVHALVKKVAPDLTAKTWYGMPAYARDGKIVLFFQSAAKFKARYATLGFNDAATLDDGDMWPTSFALTALTPAVESRIEALIGKATA